MTTEKGQHMNTRKISQQTRYIINRDEWIPEATECEHPLCDTLHKRWHKRNGFAVSCSKPAAKRVEYLIIDTQTGDRPNAYSDSYERKREAVADLERLLRRLTDAEWQQIVKSA